jgi:hypothetical protein
MRAWASVPVACGALALVVAAAALVPALRPVGWDLTALPRVDGRTLMGEAARGRDPGFHVVHPGAYDGQFYWGVAVDPIAQGDVHQRFDSPAYRYGHPLYGWLAFVASAGQARAVPAALLAVGLLALVAAAVGCSLLGRRAGGRGWEGLFVALNPGLVLALVFDLTEPLSAALLVGGLAAYRAGRRPAAVAALALLCLSKEPFVTVPLALAAWELRRTRLLRPALALGLAPLPAVLWWVYLRMHLGAWPFTQGGNAVGVPFRGWWRGLTDAGIHTYDSSAAAVSQLAMAHLVLLAASAGLFLALGLLALRLRSAEQAAFLPLAVVVACVTANVTSYPKDVLRAISVPLVLAPFVVATARRGLSRSDRA